MCTSLISLPRYFIHRAVLRFSRSGGSPFDIPGQACLRLVELIAACHFRHRHLSAKHPPCAHYGNLTINLLKARPRQADGF